MELFKKHRPKRLEAIIGNEETIASLNNMLERKTLPHTLLFHGPSGCGKTTLARILKKELDCHDMDFKEMNCSNFRGIDTIRDIARVMNLAPVGGKCRIWLLDEVHKMTNDGQNAALKMLEDTPRHVFFFLCTTEPNKILKTIQTRCCEMSVRHLAYKELERLVKRTAKREDIKLSQKVVDEIVECSQGSARTALVLLDKISNLEEGERIKAIEQKLEEENEAIELCRVLIKKRPWREVASILKNLKGEPEMVRWSVLGYARAVLLKSKNHQAYSIICAFEEPFFNSKKAGLVRACFEAVFGD